MFITCVLGTISSVGLFLLPLPFVSLWSFINTEVLHWISLDTVWTLGIDRSKMLKRKTLIFCNLRLHQIPRFQKIRRTKIYLVRKIRNLRLCLHKEFKQLSVISTRSSFIVGPTAFKLMTLRKLWPNKL